jgi:hypothetical protein
VVNGLTYDPPSSTLPLAFPACHAKLDAKENPYMTIHLPHELESSNCWASGAVSTGKLIRLEEWLEILRGPSNDKGVSRSWRSGVTPWRLLTIRQCSRNG